MTSETIQSTPRKTVRSPRPTPEVIIRRDEPTAPQTSFFLDDSEPAHSNIRIANIVNDTLWLLSLIFLLFTAIALITFRMDDPAWSRSIPWGYDVHNLAGPLGAYVADIGYYLFGFSFWWLLVAAVIFLWKNLRPLKRYATQPYRYWLGSLSLLALLLCSPIGEYLFWQQRFDESLPAGAGGLVGVLFGQAIENTIGRTAGIVVMAAVTLIAMLCLGQIAWKRLFQLLQQAIQWCRDKLASNKENALIKNNRRTIQEAHNIASQPVEPLFNNSSNRERKAQTVAQAFSAEEEWVVLEDGGNEQTVNGIKSFVPDGYRTPPLSLLNTSSHAAHAADPQVLQQTAEQIEAAFAQLELAVDVISAVSGPTITCFEIKPNRGVKSRHILPRVEELGYLLNAPTLRIVERAVGDHTLWLELPNAQRQTVSLHDIMASPAFEQSSSLLTIALGKDIAGGAVVGDLAKMPNVLIAGMEQSGKTVCLHGLILSLLYRATPDEVRLIMLDSPRQSLALYNNLPHLLCPVAHQLNESMASIQWCLAEMDRRLRLLEHFGANNLTEFNHKLNDAKQQNRNLLNPFSRNPDKPDFLENCPTVVLIISELADLNLREHPKLEQDLTRLVKKGRKVGFHLILSTQYPNVNTLTSNLKANITTRMAFTVESKIDSRAILDQAGAESLLRDGDCLLQYPGYADPIRLQSPWVSETEVQQVVAYIAQQAFPNYLDGLLTGEAATEINNTLTPNANTDPLFDEAVALVLEAQRATTSLLVRNLNVGYNRAATLMEALEEADVISPADVNGKRRILIRKDNTG